MSSETELILASIKKLTGEFLTPKHEELFAHFLNEKDCSVILDIQQLAPIVDPKNIEDFKKIMDSVRLLCDVTVKSSEDCKKRLRILREKLPEEEKKIIDDAIKMLKSDENSEVTSDADFRLMTCSRFFKTRRDLIEISELFLFLNSLFEPIPQQQNQQPKTTQQQKRK